MHADNNYWTKRNLTSRRGAIGGERTRVAAPDAALASRQHRFDPQVLMVNWQNQKPEPEIYAFDLENNKKVRSKYLHEINMFELESIWKFSIED